ncbi:hypothetical protein ACCO45_008648 [Purpureocillium lilacinum]|uniref:Uncharacterized protein n=1 Tax=Purpureocillium lilacinum TaxID=33203 RepID=A0ACC4DS02_PURLI
MHLLKTSTLCCLVVGASGLVARSPDATPTPSDLTAPIPGYGVAMPAWEVEVRPGEHLVLNGTAHEVRRQLLELNPDWKPLAAPATIETKRDVEGTTTFPPSTKVKCGEYRRPGSKYFAKVLKDAAQHLFWKYGDIKKTVQPGTCLPVGCEYDTGIWWCNDDKKEKTLHGYTGITDGLKKMWYEHLCWTDRSGRLLHPDGWSLVVTGTKVNRPC